MSKVLAALLFIVAVPLAVALAQGVVAHTPQGGSYEVQAEPITVQGIPTPPGWLAPRPALGPPGALPREWIKVRVGTDELLPFARWQSPSKRRAASRAR